MKEREVTERILGCAIAVHRAMGPGLLESIYEECLAREFVARGVAFERQKPVSLEYRGTLNAHLRLDFLVDDLVIVELKSVETILAVHEAQLLSYLRLCNRDVGLLLNFHVAALRDGIRRKTLLPRSGNP